MKAVASTVKGNVIFGDGELASIILASTPQTWQNQYNLTHSTVPESHGFCFRVDKRLKLDKPTGHNYMSSETRPIKVTNLDSDNIRANEIAIENLKTGVTAVVAVIYLSKDKLCNSRSAKRKPLANDRQESASKSEKSNRLAKIRQNVALDDNLAIDRGKASRAGANESRDDFSTCLKVKTKTIRVLLDTGSSGDLLFMQKGKIDIPIVKRAVPQSWNTSNGTFQTKKVGDINKRIVRKPYPIPKISTTLHEMEGFSYATVLDLNMGYYTIRLDPEASEICTIIFPWGKYSYKRLPMGFGGSADIFQAQMMDLMASLEYVHAYIGDLLIITRGTLDDRIEKIEIVLARLRDAGLKVNAAKSFFCTHEIEYLGIY